MLSGLLEDILTAPLKESSLQRRVLKILRSIYTLNEEDFPDNLKEDWRKLEAADHHEIDPHNAWLTKIEDETATRAMSLSRKEAKEVICAYVKIVTEITRQIGATRKGA